jgi:hypothetical protein
MNCNNSNNENNKRNVNKDISGNNIKIIIGGRITTGIICMRIKMGVTTRIIIGFTITISITTRITTYVFIKIFIQHTYFRL